MTDAPVTLTIDAESHIARIRLHRPERGNMITQAMAARFGEFLDQIDDDDDVKAVVISGDGEHLSIGWDTAELWSMYTDAPGGAVKKVPSQRARFIAQADTWWGARGIYTRLLHCRKVTILEAQGDCLETGLFLALCCDLVIGTDTSRFACPRWSTFAADGDLSLLIAAVGLKRAKDLMFTTTPWSGEQALAYGLIDWVVAGDDLEAKSTEIAEMCASIMRDGIVTEKYAVFASLEKMGIGHAFAAATVVAASLSNIHHQPGEFNFLAEIRRNGEVAALAQSRSGLTTDGGRDA